MPKRARNTFALPVQDLARPYKRAAMGPILDALGEVVYAIRAKDGTLKIGYTSDLFQRCQQVGNGIGSIIAWHPGTLADEQEVHRSLDGRAVHGREYYPWDDEQVLAVVNQWRDNLGLRHITALDGATKAA